MDTNTHPITVPVMAGPSLHMGQPEPASGQTNPRTVNRVRPITPTVNGSVYSATCGDVVVLTPSP
jgi:hypothetical protein